ncbi:MAG: MFS transporter [Verrucomicrobiales bacterium]|nr:MFS transporter [Verrucomicrobiales bacterium]
MSQPPKPRASRKEIFGWAMFDFANSSYTTVIVTVVYCVTFTKLIVGADANGEFGLGNLLWSLAIAISYGLVVFTAPVLGAVMDFAAAKKKFLFASYLVTVTGTMLLGFASPGHYVVAMLLIILSNFGFATGESFASSFLPDLGPRKDLGKISGFAWGLGYFGGLASTMLVISLGAGSATEFAKARWAGPITGVFFLVAAIPTFLWLKERGHPQSLPPGRGYLSIGFGRLASTFRALGSFRDLAVFLGSMFFAMGGLAIIVSFSFLYGDQVLKWSDSTRVLMFVLTQLTAAGGAVLFGFIQDRIGAKRTYQITLWLWIICVLAIWQVDHIAAAVNGLLGTQWQTEYVFLVLGCVAGLGIGSTQSASRGMVGILAPESKAGEFFGFWGLSGKLAAIFGLAVFGLLQYRIGLRYAIVLCAVLFFLAWLGSLPVNEHRGREAAEGGAEMGEGGSKMGDRR